MQQILQSSNSIKQLNIKKASATTNKKSKSIGSSKFKTASANKKVKQLKSKNSKLERETWRMIGPCITNWSELLTILSVLTKIQSLSLDANRFKLWNYWEKLQFYRSLQRYYPQQVWVFQQFRKRGKKTLVLCLLAQLEETLLLKPC